MVLLLCFGLGIEVNSEQKLNIEYVVYYELIGHRRHLNSLLSLSCQFSTFIYFVLILYSIGLGGRSCFCVHACVL